jgi:hypothetical protein
MRHLIYTYGLCPLFFILLFFNSRSSKAQSFAGYSSSPYAGVFAIVNNPADILNHRVRGDFNIIGINAGIGNNVIKFKYKVPDDQNNILLAKQVKKNGHLFFNTDVFGPSFLVRLNDRNALALTTRVRAMGNIWNVNKEILTALSSDTIYASALGNTTLNLNAWKEVALTYSRDIAPDGKGVWKVGASLKYIGGLAATSLAISSLSFDYDSIFDAATLSRKAIYLNMQGTVALTHTNNLDSLDDDADTYFKFTHKGFGVDIGVSYEKRDDLQVYETSYSDATANYIWKIGAAITDIGFVKYKKQYNAGFTSKLAGATYLQTQFDPPGDSVTLSQAANYYRSLFNARSEVSELVMQLPATLRLSYDRYFSRLLGVQAQLNIPLVFGNKVFYTGNFNPLSFTVTPRAATPWGGFYMPFTYNAYAGMSVGAAMRLGPLVIGSASIINTRILNKTKTFDVYMALRVPLFGYRPFKNGKGIVDTPARISKKQRRMLNCPQ